MARARSVTRTEFELPIPKLPKSRSNRCTDFGVDIRPWSGHVRKAGALTRMHEAETQVNLQYSRMDCRRKHQALLAIPPKTRVSFRLAFRLLPFKRLDPFPGEMKVKGKAKISDQ